MQPVITSRSSRIYNSLEKPKIYYLPNDKKNQLLSLIKITTSPYPREQYQLIPTP